MVEDVDVPVAGSQPQRRGPNLVLLLEWRASLTESLDELEVPSACRGEQRMVALRVARSDVKLFQHRRDSLELSRQGRLDERRIGLGLALPH